MYLLAANGTCHQSGPAGLIILSMHTYIPAGSEIILDYGPQYWKVMAKELHAAHAHEWARAETKCRHAMECLQDAEVREAIQRCLHVDLNSETTFSVEEVLAVLACLHAKC